MMSGWLMPWFVCCCFTSWQHLRSHQDRYRLVIVHTHGDFIVLPHWDHDLLSHLVPLSWHWANQFLPCSNNAKHQARNWQVSIWKSLVWLDQVLNPWAWDSNPWSLDSPISQNGRGRSTHSATPTSPQCLGRWCSEYRWFPARLVNTN